MHPLDAYLFLRFLVVRLQIARVLKRMCEVQVSIIPYLFYWISRTLAYVFY